MGRLKPPRFAIPLDWQRPATWLPDFCTTPVVVKIVLLSGLALILVQVAPNESPRAHITQLTVGMLYVLALNGLMVAALCRTGAWLREKTSYAAVLWTFALVIGLTAMGSLAAFWLDHALGLGATIDVAMFDQFVIGNSIFAAVLWGVILRYFYVNGEHQRQIKAQAEARFEALEARIRPHFLFNSLNTIASLIPTRPDQAEQAIENLADLFRVAIRPGLGPSNLAQEIELAKRYLEIEALRLGDRLVVDWRIDAADLTQPMPTLLLQPLVENAVLHGVAKLRSGGAVTIEVAQDHTHLRLQVSNPLPEAPATPAALKLSGSGVALANIKQRLALQYGDLASLRIEVSPSRYRVEVILPRL